MSHDHGVDNGLVAVLCQDETGDTASNKEDKVGTSIAQHKKGGKDLSEIQCHECKKWGHYKRECPNLQQHAQTDQVSDNEEEQSTSSRRSRRLVGAGIRWSRQS